MNFIKNIIFGIPAVGENLIIRQPKFKTYKPKSAVEFNSWTHLLKVGTRVQKNSRINPWHKDRK